MRSTRLVVLLLALPSAAFAQNTPPPAPPFPAPIIGYDGRYVDSGQTPDFQFPDRTIRTYKAKTAPELNLMLTSISGSTFAAYDLSTLPSRLASPARATGAHGEKYLAPDIVFDAQAPGSGFVIVPQDGQQFLRDFDYDRRGNFYLSYGPWGFGIIDGGGHLLSQLMPPFSVLTGMSVQVGNAYYALVSDGDSLTDVYDVTNPAAPSLVRVLHFGITAYARGTTNIALVMGPVLGPGFNHVLRVYDPSNLVNGGIALLEVDPPGLTAAFIDVTTDGPRFFALYYDSVFAFHVGTLTPQPPSYQFTDVPLGAGRFGLSIHYGAGYLGIATAPPKGVVLFATKDMTSYDLTPFVTANYTAGLAQPHDAVPFVSAGSTHLLLAFGALGDVYQLAAAAPVPALSLPALAAVALALAAIAALKLR
jgi:hypothetical protein